VSALIIQHRQLFEIVAPHYVRHRRIVAGSLVALCITASGEVAIQWYGMNLVFCKFAATRLELYIYGLSGPNFPYLGVLSLFLTYSMQIIADGLMVRVKIMYIITMTL